MTVNKRNKDEVIESAQRFTLLRALSHRENDATIRNPDYLAEKFLSEDGQAALVFSEVLKKRFESKTPGAYYYAIARTKHIDAKLDACLRDGFTQVVILGAGNDTRAYRFQESRQAVTFYELDFPGTQKLKLDRLSKLNQASNNTIIHVPIDFNSQEIYPELLDYSYDPNKKTLIIWEGVSFYLDVSSVDATLEFFSQYTAEGSQLVFDYLIDDMLNENLEYYGAKDALNWSQELNEPFLFSTNASKLLYMCKEKGLNVLSDIGSFEINEKYLMDKNQCLAGNAFDFFRFAQLENNFPEEI